MVSAVNIGMGVVVLVLIGFVAKDERDKAGLSQALEALRLSQGQARSAVFDEAAYDEARLGGKFEHYVADPGWPTSPGIDAHYFNHLYRVYGHEIKALIPKAKDRKSVV